MNNKESVSINPGNHQVAADGRNIVEAELIKQGAQVATIVDNRKTYLQVSNFDHSRTIQLRVKTKRNKGNWHSKTDDAEAIENLPDPKDETTYWVFVNLNDYKSKPQFWIVPDSWMRNDIYTAHKEYLARHGGRRAENNESNHHSIEEKRLPEWEGRWEILGII